MLYVIALRYSEPYFIHDVSSVEHVLAIKMKGLAQWHKTYVSSGLWTVIPKSHVR